MAQRFQFRLEVVRRVRKEAQRAQRRVVAEALQAVCRLEERIKELNDDLRHSISRSRDARMKPAVDVFSLRGHQMFQANAHRQILEMMEQLSHRRHELDEKRSELAELTKRLKAIETLREKRWAAYVKNRDKSEQSTYDEAMISGFIRQRCRSLPERVVT